MSTGGEALMRVNARYAAWCFAGSSERGISSSKDAEAGRHHTFRVTLRRVSMSAFNLQFYAYSSAACRRLWRAMSSAEWCPPAATRSKS